MQLLGSIRFVKASMATERRFRSAHYRCAASQMARTGPTPCEPIKVKAQTTTLAGPAIPAQSMLSSQVSRLTTTTNIALMKIR